MILNIQTGQTNPILRQKAEEIKEITPQIKKLILDMIETLEIHQGIGLAAPQVGQLFRIIVVRPEPAQKTLALVNPQIKKTSFRKKTMGEGCLSLPGLYLPIKRPNKITVEALDSNGQKIKIKTKGLSAHIIQHEIDHLEGILIVDKK